MPTRAPLASAAKRLGFDRVDLILMLVFVLVVGPWVNEVTAQPSSRYLMTAAIVEQGTVVLDDYEPALGVDRVEIDGHVYSDKAPLQPLLGVPVLALAEALGAPKASEYHDAESISEWAEGNIGAWTQTFVFAVLPGAALLPLMRRHARRFVDDRTAIVCSAAIVTSTMILMFSTYLYGHVFSAFLAFAAWHVVSSTRLSIGWRIGVSGVLAAAGFATEYPVIGAVAVLGIWVWIRHGLLRAVAFGLPTVVAGIAVLTWNNLVYGTFSTSYGQKDGTPTFIGVPKLYNTFEIFLGRKGFVFTPIVLLALAGLIVGLWQRRDCLAVPAGIFVVVFLLQASWPNPWGGETANPRYMLLALPFLVHPLTIARSWVTPLFFRALVAVGTVSMGLTVVTLELIPDGSGLVSTNLHYLLDGEVNTTMYTLALGNFGWLVYTSVALVAVVLGTRAIRNNAPATPEQTTNSEMDLYPIA